MRGTMTLGCLALAGLAASALADEVQLNAGDVLRGKVVEQSDQQVTLEHPVLGKLSVPRAQVRAVVIDPPGTPGNTGTPGAGGAAPVEGASTAAPALVEAAPAEWVTWWSDWKSEVVLGLNGAEGNTEKMSFTAGFKSARETSDTRFKFDTAYARATDRGDLNRHDLTMGLLHDWLLPDSPWFLFAQGRYDYDEFKDWDHRLAGAGGVGYELINTAEFALNLRGGFGLSREFGSQDSRITPEALLGADLKWKPTAGHELAASTEVRPDVTDPNKFRWINRVNWTIDVDNSHGLKLRFGLEHEYESKVRASNDHNDLKYLAALVFAF